MEDKLNFYTVIKYIVLALGMAFAILMIFVGEFGIAVTIALTTGFSYVVIDYFITLLETLFNISLKADYIAEDIHSKNKMED